MSSKIQAVSTLTQTKSLIYIPASLFFYHGCFLEKIKNGILFCFVFQGEEGHGKRSILDEDAEVQAMIMATGKTLHSQGLREPEED